MWLRLFEVIVLERVKFNARFETIDRKAIGQSLDVFHDYIFISYQKVRLASVCV